MLELFDCAVKDFTHALEHGEAKMGVAEKQELKAELKMAEQERDKGKDYYSILGMPKLSLCTFGPDLIRTPLGLSRSCTRAEVRKAYHAASLKHHPDKAS